MVVVSVKTETNDRFSRGGVISVVARGRWARGREGDITSLKSRAEVAGGGVGVSLVGFWSNSISDPAVGKREDAELEFSVSCNKDGPSCEDSLTVLTSLEGGGEGRGMIEK
jgi:hypothetical protein